MSNLQIIWNDIKNSLHYGPATLPLWEEMIAKLHDLETRMAELEMPKITLVAHGAIESVASVVDTASSAETIDAPVHEQSAAESAPESPEPAIKSDTPADNNLTGNSGDSIISKLFK
jgi:hypothetical protein